MAAEAGPSAKMTVRYQTVALIGADRLFLPALGRSRQDRTGCQFRATLARWHARKIVATGRLVEAWAFRAAERAISPPRRAVMAARSKDLGVRKLSGI